MPKSNPLSRALISQSPNLLIPFFFIFLLSVPARAVDISTHCFANCGFPDTGQTRCYDNGVPPAAGACPSGNAGQDGTYTLTASSPSYTVYMVDSSLVTVDNRTGLMWITNPADAGTTWADATTACGTYAAYTDWRLPNVRELMSIVDYGTQSPSINAAYFPGAWTIKKYWTSTTYAPEPDNAWIVDFTNGDVYNRVKTTDDSSVRCVRGGP